MSDLPPTDADFGEPTDGPPPPPPPPPPFGADDGEPNGGAGRGRFGNGFPGGLRRSRSDRVVAGVAGGLGQHFGIDPVIVRIGFVLLTIFGGSGILLYLLAWLVIAKDGSGETGAMRALRGSPEGNRTLLFVVLTVGAVLVLTSPLVWFDGFGISDGLALPLLLVAAGVAFLVWPTDTSGRGRREPTADPDTETAGETGEPMSSTGDEIRGELAAARDEVRSELAEARASFREQRREWRHGYRAERRAQRHARPPTPPRPRPFLGPLTIAVLLVFAGVSMVGEQQNWWDLHPAVYGGITLAGIGAGLVLSAWFGRARGLIFAGVLVLPIAWGIAAVDLDWYDGLGEQTDTVTDVADLQAEYTFGIGDYAVDLSDIDLTGDTDRSVDVALTIGELTVWVPDTLDLDISATARMGEVDIVTESGTNRDEGIDVGMSTFVAATGEEDGPTLTLDAQVGIGALDVIVCSPDGTSETRQTGEAVPCP